MPAKVDDLVLRVESVLFAAGKPMTVREITDALGAPDFRRVQSAIKNLARTYEGRQTSLEVRHVADKYALQVRAEFVPAARSVTPLDMAPRTLKALTLIAYHQPVLQSLLAKMLGEAAYEEVSRLRGLGLIQADAHGATLELRTTRTFAEYFGIASTRPQDIRQFLEEKLGVNASGPEPLAPPDGASAPSPPPVEAAEAAPVPADP